MIEAAPKASVIRRQTQAAQKKRADKGPTPVAKAATPTADLMAAKVAAKGIPQNSPAATAPCALSGEQLPLCSLEGASVLRGLAGKAVPFKWPVLARPVTVDVDLSLPLDVEKGILDIQGNAAHCGDTCLSQKLSQVRDGAMLLAADGAALCQKKAGIKADTAAEIAQELNKSVFTQSLKKQQSAMQSVLAGQRGAFPMGMDVNAFVQAVLRESYLLQNDMLWEYGENVKAFNEKKKAIREKMREAKRLGATLKDGEYFDFDFESFCDEEYNYLQEPGGSTIAEGTTSEASSGIDTEPSSTPESEASSEASSGTAEEVSSPHLWQIEGVIDNRPLLMERPMRAVGEPMLPLGVMAGWAVAGISPDMGSSASGMDSDPGSGAHVFNKEAFKAYIDHLESTLDTVGEDAQLANVDLQDALQKQQQTLQMLSNISKMLHDTAMSIIGKLGG